MRRLINRSINRHLRNYERDFPFLERLKRCHRERIIFDAGPIFWTLAFWWRPRFQWLWRLRCRNVDWRMVRHNQRVAAERTHLNG